MSRDPSLTNVFRDHKKDIRTCGFSPDSRLLFSGAFDSIACVYKLDKYVPLPSVNQPSQSGGGERKLAAESASWDGWKLLGQAQCSGLVLGGAFRNSQELVLGGGGVMCFDLTSSSSEEEEEEQEKNHQQPSSPPVFKKKWTVDSKFTLKESGSARCFRFTHDTSVLVVSYDKGYVVLFDADSGKPSRSFKVNHLKVTATPIYGMCLSCFEPESSKQGNPLVVYAVQSNQLHRCEFERVGGKEESMEEKEDFVRASEFAKQTHQTRQVPNVRSSWWVESCNEKGLIAVCDSSSSSIQLYDERTEKFIDFCYADNDYSALSSCAFTGRGNFLVAGALSPKAGILLFDISKLRHDSSNKIIHLPIVLTPPELAKSPVWSVSGSPDSQFFAGGFYDKPQMLVFSFQFLWESRKPLCLVWQKGKGKMSTGAFSVYQIVFVVSKFL